MASQETERTLSAFGYAEVYARTADELSVCYALIDEQEAVAVRLRQRMLNVEEHLRESVSEERPRRVFDLGKALVMVERYAKPRRKYKAGEKQPPIQYGVRVEVIKAEKESNFREDEPC